MPTDKPVDDSARSAAERDAAVLAEERRVEDEVPALPMTGVEFVRVRGGVVVFYAQPGGAGGIVQNSAALARTCAKLAIMVG